MHPRRVPVSLRALVGSTVVAIALAACTSDTTSPDTQLTPDETQTIGASIATEIESSLTLMTPGAATTEAPAPRWVQAARGVAPGIHPAVQWSAVASCPTVNPYPIVDTDGDGVPDGELLSYTLPACAFSDGTGSIEVTGTLQVNDPQPNTAGLTANATATQLRSALFDASHVQLVAVTHTGSWSVSASSGGAQENWSLSTIVEVQNHPTVTITNAWLGAFTPDQGETLTLGAPLPPGTFAAAGGFSLSDGTRSFVITLDTSTPLAYDPVTCNGDASSLTAGEAHATFNSGGPKGYLRVVWASCAAPTYVFVATG